MNNKEDELKIENCNFLFQCTKDWPSLTKTELVSVRYCTDCDRGVHLCETDAQVIEAKNNRWCVAIPATLTFPDDEEVADDFMLTAGGREPDDWFMGDLTLPDDMLDDSPIVIPPDDADKN